MFFFDKTILKPQQRFKSYLHKVYTEKVNKTALSSNDKNPENIRYDEDVLKTSWRGLWFSSSEDFLIKTIIFVLLICLQKTSSSRPTYSPWSYAFKTSSIRFQDALKTSPRRFQGMFKASSRRLQDVLKTSSRSLQVVFKTFRKRLLDVFKASSRCFEDVLSS